jgi:hypothetical protein
MSGQFDTTVAGSRLSITSVDPEGEHPFILVLWELKDLREAADAKPVLTWIPLEKLSTSDLIVAGSGDWKCSLARLWRVARTQALKIDERLDGVLAELGHKAPASG